MKRWVLSYLQGEQPLWKAFWLVWVFGSLVLFPGLVVLIGLGQGGISIWRILSLLGGVMLGYGPLGAYVTWRCANNTSDVVWTFLARTIVVFAAMVYLALVAYLGVILFMILW